MRTFSTTRLSSFDDAHVISESAPAESEKSLKSVSSERARDYVSLGTVLLSFAIASFRVLFFLFFLPLKESLFSGFFALPTLPWVRAFAPRRWECVCRRLEERVRREVLRAAAATSSAAVTPVALLAAHVRRIFAAGSASSFSLVLVSFAIFFLCSRCL